MFFITRLGNTQLFTELNASPTQCELINGRNSTDWLWSVASTLSQRRHFTKLYQR